MTYNDHYQYHEFGRIDELESVETAPMKYQSTKYLVLKAISK